MPRWPAQGNGLTYNSFGLNVHHQVASCAPGWLRVGAQNVGACGIQGLLLPELWQVTLWACTAMHGCLHTVEAKARNR